jgi:xanthine dehydrogenase large subunit
MRSQAQPAAHRARSFTEADLLPVLPVIRLRRFLSRLHTLHVHQVSREAAASFSFELNGKRQTVRGLSTNLTLLQYLRNEGLTGAKEGCAEGDCGACSVAIVEFSAEGKPVYRAINSCLIPVLALAGRSVITVEGLASEREKLHPVQQAMVERHGSQCGFCTPGIVMSLFEAYHRKDLQREWQVDDQLSGNLCRCTGYRPIREAALALLASRNQTVGHTSINSEPAQSSVEYEYDSQLFFCPTNLKSLLERVRDYPEAKLLAGGTELGLAITKKFQTFPVLISIERVPELRTIECVGGEWRIGAAATLTDIWDRLGATFPALGEMFRWFGSRQIRNRATLGGNLVTASPIGDAAPVLLGLDAELIIASLAGERRIPLDEFFIGYRKTALREGEILKEIILPRADPDLMPGGRTSSCAADREDAIPPHLNPARGGRTAAYRRALSKILRGDTL